MLLVRLFLDCRYAELARTVVRITAGVQIGRLHTTEAELLIYDLKAHTFATEQFTGLEEKIIEADAINKCRWLSTEIRALKDTLYVRKRDAGDPDYIHDLEGQLEELETSYTALSCALKLA